MYPIVNNRETRRQFRKVKALMSSVLPRPYLRLFMKRLKEATYTISPLDYGQPCISAYFSWEKTKEGYAFWDLVDSYVSGSSETLPAIPTSLTSSES
jgi:hypothetical protein